MASSEAGVKGLAAEDPASQGWVCLCALRRGAGESKYQYAFVSRSLPGLSV